MKIKTKTYLSKSHQTIGLLILIENVDSLLYEGHLRYINIQQNRYWKDEADINAKAEKYCHLRNIKIVSKS